MMRPVEGSMSEYCVHVRNPRVPLHVWAKAFEKRNPKGVRYQVHGIWVSTDPTTPPGSTHKVGEFVFGGPWIVLGDLTFVHGRGGPGAEAYASAMNAIKKASNMGGFYESPPHSHGIAFRLALRELRMPMQLSMLNGVLRSFSFEADPEWVIDDEGGSPVYPPHTWMA